MMKKNKKLKFWLLGIAAFLIAVVFCLWPTQYYIEAPGEEMLKDLLDWYQTEYPALLQKYRGT